MGHDPWQMPHDVFWALSSYPRRSIVVLRANPGVGGARHNFSFCQTPRVLTNRDEARTQRLWHRLLGIWAMGIFTQWLSWRDGRSASGHSRQGLRRSSCETRSRDTCTGAGGISKGKNHSIGHEKGSTAVKAMRPIKCALDPAGIRNPGKII
jgi:hypothetical protein